MTTNDFLIKCFISLYVLCSVGSLALLFALVYNVYQEFCEDNPYRGERKETEKNSKIKVFLCFMVFLTPILNFIMLIYLLARTETVAETIYDCLEEIYK